MLPCTPEQEEELCGDMNPPAERYGVAIPQGETPHSMAYAYCVDTDARVKLFYREVYRGSRPPVWKLRGTYSLSELETAAPRIVESAAALRAHEASVREYVLARNALWAALRMLAELYLSTEGDREAMEREARAHYDEAAKAHAFLGPDLVVFFSDMSAEALADTLRTHAEPHYASRVDATRPTGAQFIQWALISN